MGYGALFWSKVHIEPENPDACWPWMAYRDRQGYGVFSLGRKAKRAHVLSFLECGGQVSESKPIVMHLCNNSSCVNPAHLKSGTHKENIQESVRIKTQKNARKTHCVRGHPLSGENLTKSGLRKGKRICRACENKRALSYYYTGTGAI